ncbi:dethiobiotin synthase [Polynucleobacter necessarius]|uniref:dethiobiotin synthase n=1 Tax=Polynucleobacter necessarius TaxID=576610 RepID=UPI001E628494|nr:dethiobiotin synthase [Polynucleobacter necessarius]
MMRKHLGFFITGTDTEVGKTLVSGALILKLRHLNKNTLGFKPVVAGTYTSLDGQLFNEDLETLRIASSLKLGEENLCPYVLDIPAAPHLVAQDLGIDLELGTMLEAYHGIRAKCDWVVCEGAGGFFTPLNHKEDLSDFAKAIDLPVILMVGMKLGCINHALLTCAAIKNKDLKIAGWVANTLSTEMSYLDENIKTLRSRIEAPFLGLIPTFPKSIEKPINKPYSIEAMQFAAQHIVLPD